MSFSRAPTAIRMPISRMRSVTETSMMFMIPIPPTRSEMEAMLPRRMPRIWVDWAAPSAISDMFRTWKSSSAPGAILWRMRRSSSICPLASTVRSIEIAWTSMLLMWSSRASLFMTVV